MPQGQDGKSRIPFEDGRTAQEIAGSLFVGGGFGDEEGSKNKKVAGKIELKDTALSLESKICAFHYKERYGGRN